MSGRARSTIAAATWRNVHGVGASHQLRPRPVGSPYEDLFDEIVEQVSPLRARRPPRVPNDAPRGSRTPHLPKTKSSPTGRPISPGG